MGMTAETFERVYGHHHPDYQLGASEAVGNFARQKRDKYLATKRERAASKVIKMADKG